ncbi:unnamed protein product [Camellia sinensis]
MAASVSSTVLASTVSSASSFKARNYSSFKSQIPFCFNHLSFSCASNRLVPRKLFRVQATVLQDDEEKVVVEESFQPKTIPVDDGKGIHGESSTSSSSSGLERWVIKLEQSINIFLTDSVVKILDTLYNDRDYARFYVLETIARVPYFAFISVLHLYESFGWWRRADYLKVHFAESWNEMHHLLIMESWDILSQELGGNAWWFDRFLAQHIANHFSECVEIHAYETYDKFIKARGDELKKLPAPEVAVKYYTGGDLYLFDEFQTARVPNSRRPKIVVSFISPLVVAMVVAQPTNMRKGGFKFKSSDLMLTNVRKEDSTLRAETSLENLYDVFMNIREDEGEHCKTMKACQIPGNLHSPHSYQEDTFEEESGFIVAQADCEDQKMKCHVDFRAFSFPSIRDGFLICVGVASYKLEVDKLKSKIRNIPPLIA